MKKSELQTIIRSNVNKSFENKNNSIAKDFLARFEKREEENGEAVIASLVVSCVAAYQEATLQIFEESLAKTLVDLDLVAFDDE